NWSSISTSMAKPMRPNARHRRSARPRTCSPRPLNRPQRKPQRKNKRTARVRDKPVVLGHVSGLFGVRGWIKVYSHTRPPANLLAYERWFVGASDSGRPLHWRPFRVVAAKPHGKTLIAQLADAEDTVVADRATAAALLDCDIAVARADMPALAAGEYYWHDLIGLEVINRDGEALGRVSTMMETGANDVLVVDGDRR